MKSKPTPETWARARELALKNLREMTEEEDARITADALSDPDAQPTDELMRRKGTKFRNRAMLPPLATDYDPGSFGCHEALHTAGVVMDLVETSLVDHPAIGGRPEWHELATKAHKALFDLHQAIGAEHLKSGEDIGNS